MPNDQYKTSHDYVIIHYYPFLFNLYFGDESMLSTTAYILISTIITHGDITQSTVTFANKSSCESAAVRQDFVLKSLNTFNTKWNLSCHPYFHDGDAK